MKKLTAIISAIAMLGALITVPVNAAVGDTITLQVEEATSVTKNGTVTPLTQNDMASVNDFTKYYASNAEQPTYGETGNGVQIASWGTKVYALTLRPANGGLDSLTYTFNAPCAGDYDMDIYAGNWDSVALSVSVNGADAITSDYLTKNLTDYHLSTANAATNFVKDGTIAISLNKGENTIVVKTNKSVYLDKFVLTCTKEATGGISYPKITTQAEAATSATYKGEVKSITQSDMGVADFTKYYSSGADQPTYGETGEGLQVASWGTKVYALTLRPSGGGLDSLTYSVNASYAGTYNLILRAGSWVSDATPTVKVNGTSKTMSTLTQNLTNYSLTTAAADTNFVETIVGQVELKKGDNTLTFTTSKAFYFDAFTLDPVSVSNEIEYVVNGESADEIATGTLSVNVNHGVYSDGEYIVGAVYADDRLASAKVASITKDTTSTTLDFGTFDTAATSYNFKYFVFSSLSALTPATKGATTTPTPTPTPNPADSEPADLGGIVVQAEEATSATMNGTTTELTQTAMGGVADFTKYYATDATQPNYGETGDGIVINSSYGTKAYALTLRKANGGLDSLTYTVNAPEAGSYTLYFNVGSWYAAFAPTVTVNGSAVGVSLMSPNLSGYSLTAGEDNFKLARLGNIALNEGDNTVVVTTSTQFYFDALVFVKASDTDPIKVEAEEFDSYVVIDEYTTPMALFTAYNNLGSFNAGGTGNGVQGNDYNKVYAMTFHSSGDDSGIAYYTVNIPKAGKYKVVASAATKADGQALTIESTADGSVANTITLTPTSSYSTYQENTGDVEFDLPAGEFEFCVYGGDCYADYFSFTLQK